MPPLPDGGDAAGPPAAVLAAFGVRGPGEPLSGGTATAWRYGEIVLKPLDADPQLIEWLAEVLPAVDGDPGFRVAPPVPAGSGALVVAGWTAWRHEPGRPTTHRWADLLEAGRAFHAALSNVPRPAFLAGRQDRWATADRIAWDDDPPPADLDAIPHLRALLCARRPVRADEQLVHGDLGGNVLFADGVPPAVIDVSPYWRAPAYADAVVVADALLDHDGDPSLVDQIPAPAGQYLLRAATFRLLAEIGHGADVSGLASRYARVVDLALTAARSEPG